MLCVEPKCKRWLKPKQFNIIHGLQSGSMQSMEPSGPFTNYKNKAFAAAESIAREREDSAAAE